MRRVCGDIGGRAERFSGACVWGGVVCTSVYSCLHVAGSGVGEAIGRSVGRGNGGAVDVANGDVWLSNQSMAERSAKRAAERVAGWLAVWVAGVVAVLFCGVMCGRGVAWAASRLPPWRCGRIRGEDCSERCSASRGERHSKKCKKQRC